MTEEYEVPERPQSLVVRGPKRVEVNDWDETLEIGDVDGERLWSDLIKDRPETEYVLAVKLKDDELRMQGLVLYCDPTAGVLYTFIYSGLPPGGTYRPPAIWMMEAWRQAQNNDNTHLIRRIIVPIAGAPMLAREFDSLGSLDDIRPTGHTEWRILEDCSILFTNLMGTSLGQIITEAATLYRVQFVRSDQNFRLAEVKQIRLLLPAKGEVKTFLPIEAVEFSFE